MVSFELLFYPVLAVWVVSSFASCYLWRKNKIKIAWSLSIFNVASSIYLFIVYTFIGEGASTFVLFFFMMMIVYSFSFWYLNIRIREVWEEERYANLRT